MPKEEIINLVIRQTNYDRDLAIQKLNEWKGNYINVIKEYLNPNFQKKKKTNKKSKNEKMMSAIRNFMDDISIQYEKRKQAKDALEKKIQLQKIIELERKKQKIEFERKLEEELQIKNKNIEMKKKESEKKQKEENEKDGIIISEV